MYFVIIIVNTRASIMDYIHVRTVLPFLTVYDKNCPRPKQNKSKIHRQKGKKKEGGERAPLRTPFRSEHSRPCISLSHTKHSRNDVELRDVRVRARRARASRQQGRRKPRFPSGRGCRPRSRAAQGARRAARRGHGDFRREARPEGEDEEGCVQAVQDHRERQGANAGSKTAEGKESSSRVVLRPRLRRGCVARHFFFFRNPREDKTAAVMNRVPGFCFSRRRRGRGMG